MTPELKKAVEAYEEAATLYKLLARKMDVLRETRDALCKHQDGETVSEDYCPGGYLDSSCETTYYSCKVCGAPTKPPVRSYGGYG